MYYFVRKRFISHELNYSNSDAVVKIMSTDFRLDTNGRDLGFNTLLRKCIKFDPPPFHTTLICMNAEYIITFTRHET